MRTQHPIEVHGVQELLDDGVEVHELTLRELMEKTYITLAKIEIHLSLLTGNEITEEDIK